MLAINYRNAVWSELQACIQGKRLEVLSAWRQHGPCTTRELAERSGIDLLTLRPRTTELLQIGYIREVADVPGKEGVYESLPESEAFAIFNSRCADARGDKQLAFAI
jgi:DNA-binding MarR family transcriptional regulator